MTNDHAKMIHQRMIRQNYHFDDDPHPPSFFRAKRRENFKCDSNTGAFCAKGAERIFFQKRNPETAKDSLCKIAFSLLNI